MPVFGAKCGAIILAVLANACVTHSSAVRTDIERRESRALIGFSGDGAMILLADRQGSREIREFQLPSGPERTLFELDGSSEAHGTSLARKHGWRKLEWWSDQEIALKFTSEATLGDRRVLRVLAEKDRLAIRVAEIPIDEETAVELVRAPDDRYVVLRLLSEHRERVHVVDIKAAQSAIENRRALDALEAGDLLRAAALLEQAVEADPRAGDAVYNLACVHARLGDLERAADELSIALAISPEIYRRIAKADPDLAAVRNLPRIAETLGLDTGVPN